MDATFPIPPSPPDATRSLSPPDATRPLLMLLAEQEAETFADIATRAMAGVAGLVVLQAPDGAEAIRAGLHYKPALAIIDLGLPMSGLGAAITLHELRPAIRLAAHSNDVQAYRDGARELGLPFFARGNLTHLVDWVLLECAALSADRAPTGDDCNLGYANFGYVCAECGYGVTRALPPDRCPICQLERWTPEPWRPFSRTGTLVSPVSQPVRGRL